MAQLNFTITATQAEFNNFADRLGYMQMVKNTEGIAIPNPETASQFLQTVLKEKVAAVFYTPFVSEVDQQVSNTRNTEKESIKTDVRSRVGVSFVA